MERICQHCVQGVPKEEIPRFLCTSLVLYASATVCFTKHIPELLFISSLMALVRLCDIRWIETEYRHDISYFYSTMATLLSRYAMAILCLRGCVLMGATMLLWHTTLSLQLNNLGEVALDGHPATAQKYRTRHFLA